MAVRPVETVPSPRRPVRQVGRASRLTFRPTLVDALTIVGLTGLVALVYLWTDAPLYNPPGSVDPWLYTALWTNFDQIYPAFAGTYYVSRIPWIVPGYALNELFDARTASLVLHSTLFLVGGGLFYLLCRRHLGALAATIGYLALIANPLYFRAHRWDYQEGAVLTFMIATLAFGLPATNRPVPRALSMGASGAFAAALVSTRIIDIAYLIGLPLLYLAVLHTGRWRERLRQFFTDLVAWEAGAFALILFCGIFSTRHGTEFWYFMPQWRVVRAGSGEHNQIPVDQWLPHGPYFWLPIFAIVLGGVALVLNRSANSIACRILVATVVWLTLDFTGFALWQFLGPGWLFNIGYYFSSFLVPTLLCLAAAVAVLFGVRPLSKRDGVLVGAGAVAAFAPLVWIYRTDAIGRLALGYDSRAYLVAIGAFGAAVILVLLTRIPRLRIAAIGAVVVTLFGTTHAVGSSVSTFDTTKSDPKTGDLYDLGQKLIGFLHANGYQKQLPYFWYDASRPYGVGSLQSLYYFSYTYVGIAMPTIDEDFRNRMTAFQPTQLVLLCGEPNCAGGGLALRRAGFPSKEITRQRLDSGRERLWVVIRALQPAES